MSARIKRSQEEVSRLLTEWKASGMSARAFAGREGVPVSTLYQWARRSRSERAAPVPPKSADHAFVALEVGDRSVRGEASFRILLQGERQLEVPRGFDRDELVRLLDVLEG